MGIAGCTCTHTCNISIPVPMGTDMHMGMQSVPMGIPFMDIIPISQVGISNGWVVSTRVERGATMQHANYYSCIAQLHLLHTEQ